MNTVHVRSTCRALLWPNGDIEQVDDVLGASLLAAAPELVHYALALPASSVDRAAFVWLRPREPWLLVSLARVRPRGDDLVAVMVELDAKDPPPFSLTPRELDILTLLCSGFTNPEIADRLHTSRSTVATHVERVLAKLGQRYRAGATAIALECGLVRLPIPGGPAGFEHLAIGAIEACAQAGHLTSEPSVSLVRRRAEPRPLVVGLAVANEGLVGSDRDEFLNGSDLAIAEVNERGGVNGRPLERLTVDIAIDDSASVRDGFRQLMAADVDVIVLNYAWIEDYSVFSTVSSYGCPVLTSLESDRQALWVSEHPETLGRVFQVGSVWSHYGTGFFRALSTFAQSGTWQPANRNVILIETSVGAGQVYDEEAAAAARGLGWQVERILEVATLDADWSEALAAIRESSPAAVLVTHFVPKELARFQRLFVQHPRDTLVHCIYAPSFPEYQDQAGAAAEGVLWSTVNGTYADDIGKAFMRSYELRFGRPPGRSVAGTAYDQVNIIINAWVRARNPRAFELVADELRRGVYRGVSGVYWLGNPRQTGLSYPEDTLDLSTSLAALVFQIQDGSSRIISPTPYAESELRLPSWFSTGLALAQSPLSAPTVAAA